MHIHIWRLVRQLAPRFEPNSSVYDFKFCKVESHYPKNNEVFLLPTVDSYLQCPDTPQHTNLKQLLSNAYNICFISADAACAQWKWRS